MTLVRVNNKKRESHYPTVFDQVFDRFLSDPEWSGASRVMKPLANVAENENNFEIEFAIPGYSKKDVSISIDNDVLIVKGTKNEDEKDTRYNRKEFSYSEFERSFSLPENIDQDKLSASFKNGVLSVVLPKAPVVKPEVRQIEIR